MLLFRWIVMVLLLAAGVSFAFFHARLTRALTAAGAKNQLEADLREMTRLHEQLQQLNREHRVFVSLLENSPDFIGIADASGKPIFLNPAGRKMVGLPDDLPVEHTEISDYYPPDQRAFAEEFAHGVRERGAGRRAPGHVAARVQKASCRPP